MALEGISLSDEAMSRLNQFDKDKTPTSNRIEAIKNTMRDKYGAEHDQHCYPDSQTLINKLNITDEDPLCAAEARRCME